MFRDLRVGLWVIFKNYFQVDERQANEKQKLPPAHTQKTPCGFLSTGGCQFPIRGVNTFRRGGIFVRREQEKPGDQIGSGGQTTGTQDHQIDHPLCQITGEEHHR